MPTQSRSTTLGVGLQTSHDAAPVGSYRGMVQSEVKAVPMPTVEDVSDEVGMGLVATAGPYRLGVWTPISGRGRVRLGSLPQLLRMVGLNSMTHSHSGVVTTHVLTPVSDVDDIPWASFLHGVGQDSNRLLRVLSDGRLGTLKLLADANSLLKFEFAGVASHEEIATGLERTINEFMPPLNTVQGSLSILDSGAGTLVGSVTNLNLEMGLDLSAEGDEIPVAGYEPSWLSVLRIRALADADASFQKDLFLDLFYNGSGAAGAGYSLQNVVGSLSVTYQSAMNIPGSSTPFSVTVELPTVEVSGGEWQSSGRGQIRMPVVMRPYQAGANPLIRVTVVTNQVSLDGVILAGTWSGAGLPYTARSA